MSIAITLNGVNYTANIGDVDFSVKENKSQAKNIKGDSLTTPPRSSTPRVTVKTTIYYVPRSTVDTLNGLYLAGQPIPATFTGLDLPGGNYVIGECAWQLVKNLSNIIYNIALTLYQDLPATCPNPATPAIPLTQAGVATKLGF